MQATGVAHQLKIYPAYTPPQNPDHIAPGEKMWRDALATGKPWHTEERVRRADGEYHWFAIDRVAARDENDEQMGVVSWTVSERLHQSDFW